jgi:hypothetical protein
MESSTDIEMIEPALPAASASVLQYGGSSSSSAPSTKSVKIGPTVAIEDKVSIPMATASTSTASDDLHLVTFQLVNGAQEFDLQVPDTGTLGKSTTILYYCSLSSQNVEFLLYEDTYRERLNCQNRVKKVEVQFYKS